MYKSIELKENFDPARSYNQYTVIHIHKPLEESREFENLEETCGFESYYVDYTVLGTCTKQPTYFQLFSRHAGDL